MSYVIANTADEVMDRILSIKEPFVAFFDVDDTLITPVSPTCGMIDEIKSQKEQYPNYTNILSTWRLHRKARLLDKQWPMVLKTIKKNAPCYGLTKVDVGMFGDIPSMEEWRWNELNRMGIVFSEEEEALKQGGLGSSFYRGIFMTGAASKSETLRQFNQYTKASTLVLVDDHIDNLNELNIFCAAQDKHFIGILYQSPDLQSVSVEPAVLAFQKKQLTEHGVWSEYAEAAAQLGAEDRTY